MTNVVKDVIPSFDVFKNVSPTQLVPKQQNASPKPGIGVLTVEEQNKMTNPAGTVSLNKMV